ncbi:hypothetical protein QTO20_18475 [Serratia marcescens]|uniref:hypothetical protein n=1 Tax=Serratia marcescens TaxID=615 RepID=UPI0038968BD0
MDEFKPWHKARVGGDIFWRRVTLVCLVYTPFYGLKKLFISSDLLVQNIGLLVQCWFIIQFNILKKQRT